VTAATRDDAAVFRISDERTIVATVDFFTPIVDDPYAFGAIAAANAFSDLYAMGATPLFALNLVGWPREPEMLELLEGTLRGSADVAREAGALVLGGHSIDDREPKFGMVAVGEAHPDEIITISGAQPGDQLVLTKPVGTGILSTALKRDLISETGMEDAISAMRTLNAGALRAVRSVGAAVHAVTDVTGFGLLGHLWNMLSAGGASARLWVEPVPVFGGVRELIQAGAVPGGTKRNQEAAAEWTTWTADVGETDRTLLSDAQTSGGLLIAVAADRCDEMLRALAEQRTPAAAVVGEIVAAEPGHVLVAPQRD
jgi:selenide,water dikinase